MKETTAKMRVVLAKETRHPARVQVMIGGWIALAGAILVTRDLIFLHNGLHPWPAWAALGALYVLTGGLLAPLFTLRVVDRVVAFIPWGKKSQSAP